MNELKPHQIEGAEYLALRPRALLLDEPGAGKTATAAYAAELVNSKRTLVLCPASAVGVWKREWPMWSKAPEPTVLSYDSAGKVPLVGYDLYINDEAHYLKTRTATRTKTSYKGVAHRPQVWSLSGSIMPNKSPGELYTHVKALFPHLHSGDFDSWLDRWCDWFNGEYGPVIKKIKDPEAFQAFVKSISLGRTLEEVGIHLPELWFQDWRLDSTPSEREKIRQMAIEANFGEDDDLNERDPYLATLRRMTGTLKADKAAVQILEALEGTEVGSQNAVVFAYHEDVLNILEAKLEAEKVIVYRVDGSTSHKTRSLYEEVFQKGGPGPRVFLGQIDACHSALTLHRARMAFLVEPSWTPEINYQAAKRIHRMGQKHPCIIRRFILSGTMDEGINRTLRRKETLQ